MPAPNEDNTQQPEQPEQPTVASAGFYADLPAIAVFDQVFSDAPYQDAPQDWFVVVSDIKGATEAIEAGRYKDVNLLGAATIVAAQNALDNVSFPYVFGGDGATLLLPPKAKNRVLRALDGTRRLAKENFDLALRVGVISVAEVLEKGGQIQVAKLQLAGESCMAIFRGGGLTIAERCIKGQPEKYEVGQLGAPVGNLDGLSCRWQPIPAKNGVVASMLIAVQDPSHEDAYAEVLAQINTILSDDIGLHNPVHIETMTYQPLAEILRNERRYHDTIWSWSFLKRFTEIFIAVLIFTFHIPPLVFDAKHYAKSMETHSDFRKFDDMLRMVVDCSPQQLARIRRLLAQQRALGVLHYGIHEASHALMTCLVHDVKDGQHVHFVDGGDGGYAMAAKELKAQIRGQTINRQDAG